MTQKKAPALLKKASEEKLAGKAGAGPKKGDRKAELKAKAEKDVGSVDVGGDAWVAHRAEENDLEIAAEHFNRIGRESRAVAEVAVGTPVEFGEEDLLTTARGRGL